MANTKDFFRDDLDDRDVIVTIHCIAYNQEKYIHSALEGFVQQKTNFRYEAIVHDDASTDGTAEIIRRYAEKYPSIIKPIFELENQYCKRDGSIERIMIDHSRGKYIAICEGDDYWTDPLKLQKQVDFLESYSDYSMCFHNATLHWEDGRSEDQPFYELEEREYHDIEMLEEWIVPTASIMIRIEVFRNDLYRKALNRNFPGGDIVICLVASKLGKIFCLNSMMSVYVKRTDGAAHYMMKNRIKFLKDRYKLCFFGRDISKFIKKKNSKAFIAYILENVRDGNWSNAFLSLILVTFHSPCRFSLEIFKYFFNRFKRYEACK